MKWEKYDKNSWYTPDDKWFIDKKTDDYILSRSFGGFIATFKKLKNAKKVAELIEEG